MVEAVNDVLYEDLRSIVRVEPFLEEVVLQLTFKLHLEREMPSVRVILKMRENAFEIDLEENEKEQVKVFIQKVVMEEQKG